MKKTIKITLLFVAIAICIVSVSFAFPSFLKNAKNYLWYISGNVQSEADQWLCDHSFDMMIESFFHIASSFSCTVICAFLTLQTIRSSNLDHAARLTYEEYKERAKQKKLEKTKKKMQELEKKLQKESTE